jgi:hypothetical protein
VTEWQRRGLLSAHDRLCPSLFPACPEQRAFSLSCFACGGAFQQQHGVSLSRKGCVHTAPTQRSVTFCLECVCVGCALQSRVWLSRHCERGDVFTQINRSERAASSAPISVEAVCPQPAASAWRRFRPPFVGSHTLAGTTAFRAPAPHRSCCMPAQSVVWDRACIVCMGALVQRRR